MQASQFGGFAMPSVTLERAQTDLPGLIRGLLPGEELVITENGREVAALAHRSPAAPANRVSGFWIGKVTILADDEDHLTDFAEYMS